MSYRVLIFDLHETVITLQQPYESVYQSVVKNWFGVDIPASRIQQQRHRVWTKIGSSNIINESKLLTHDTAISEWWAQYHADIVCSLLPFYTSPQKLDSMLR